MLCPFPAQETQPEARAAADPVNKHAKPDAGQAHVEFQHKNVAQNHAEQPHADDAYRHGVLGVAAAAQGIF